MNQTEWYMSKKFRALNNLIVVSPYILRYCSGGAFCGIIVPMMDAEARPIRRKRVSFNEQKKFHRELVKPLFVDVKEVLLKRRNYEIPNTMKGITKKMLPLSTMLWLRLCPGHFLL
jgi:hypothetical protein